MGSWIKYKKKEDGKACAFGAVVGVAQEGVR